MKFYEVSITMTSKPMGRTGQDWATFDRQEKRFKTIGEVKAWLLDEYGTSKRVKMYRDTKEGSEHVGYIYCMKGYDYEHGERFHYFRQDWIDIDEMSSTRVIVH